MLLISILFVLILAPSSAGYANAISCTSYKETTTSHILSTAPSTTSHINDETTYTTDLSEQNSTDSNNKSPKSPNSIPVLVPAIVTVIIALVVIVTVLIINKVRHHIRFKDNSKLDSEDVSPDVKDVPHTTNAEDIKKPRMRSVNNDADYKEEPHCTYMNMGNVKLSFKKNVALETNEMTDTDDEVEYSDTAIPRAAWKHEENHQQTLAHEDVEFLDEPYVTNMADEQLDLDELYSKPIKRSFINQQ
jgi:hypothetical protein